MPPAKEVKIYNSQARGTVRVTGTLKCHVMKMQKKTPASLRDSTFSTCLSASSSPSNRPRSSTPRMSSEHGSINSDETQRSSFTDEAQTSYNILVILRTDTQHLISLRNENLPALEDKSALSERDASSRIALLACINESITAATQSITQLGPFLDKHRWPAASRPTTRESQRPSFIIALKPRRRRSKSVSGLAESPHVTEDEKSILSPADLFSWTLLLTAQHTAILVATERLCTFLESGIANVSEEERRRRDARTSWWEQDRGGFENVGLIQSLLKRSPRAVGETSAESEAPVATNSTLTKAPGDQDGMAENLTPIMEHDDGRSETLFSEAFTPSTLTLTPKGLTARPRQERLGSLQHDEGFSVRRVFTEPLTFSSPGLPPSNETQISRMETFGSEKAAFPLSRFSFHSQRPRIPTPPLFSTVPLANTLSEALNQSLEHDENERSPITGLLSESDYLYTGDVPPLARYTQEPTAAFPPNTSSRNPNISPTNLPIPPSQVQERLVPSPSPGTKTTCTPSTPLEPNLTSPQELNHKLPSPNQAARHTTLRILPVETRSRASTAPVIEGPDSLIVSPVETDSGTFAQPLLGVSPITITESHERVVQDDNNGGHMAWLVYMQRKREVSASRWSLRRHEYE